MSAYATKQEVQEIVDKAVTDLSEIISTFAQQVDTRFNKIEKELSELRESHHRLLNTIDGFVGRIDRYETEQLMRDNQFNRLLEWARRVSEKTGVPLENL
jgi:septal ring factor EnvC (AmiA/AmiB activator)